MNTTQHGITTHVLDVSRGLPAANVTVRLERQAGEAWESVSQSVTDADGRARFLEGSPAAGDYRLTFEVASYFAAQGEAAFYPVVTVVFSVRETRHHHVPLLLSPFGYSTYRGS